jgi:hypothetical protein
MYTKQDFVTAAATIRKLKPAEKQPTINALVEKFKKSNPRFDVKQFYVACGIEAGGLPSFVQKTFRYQLSIDNLFPWDKLGCQIDSVTLDGKTYEFDRYVVQTRYSKPHAWAGQVQRTFIDVRTLYNDMFKKEYWISEARDDSGSVCMGSHSIDVNDFFLECLYQIKDTETESCSNLMGPWIAYVVEMENVPKFEVELAYHIDTIKRMKISTCD